MTIDEIGRQAGDELRTRTAADTDVDAGIEDLFRRIKRRRNLRTGTAILAAAAVGGVVALALRSDLVTSESEPADPAPTTESSAVAAPTNNPCNYTFLTCRDGSPVAIEMPAPITWKVPEGFGPGVYYTSDVEGQGLISVEMYRDDVDGAAGVTVSEDVAAARQSRVPAADTAVGDDAESIADWVASRPDLTASKVSKVEVGNLEGWSVEVAAKHPGRPGVGRCSSDRFPCTPIVYLNRSSDTSRLQGVPGDMTSRFTFVDVPGAGTSVIWSWAFGDPRHLDGNEPMVESIRFGDSELE